MQTYFVELTDTFGGEANYSWVTRCKVRASSFMGAARKVAREAGLFVHKVADYGDSVRYDSESGATCMFVQHWDDSDAQYSNVKEL